MQCENIINLTCTEVSAKVTSAKHRIIRRKTTCMAAILHCTNIELNYSHKCRNIKKAPPPFVWAFNLTVAKCIIILNKKR